jgi:hypothetical protein
MGAQLNINSEDACRLASRPSELTAESLTAVVTKARQVKLDRQERQRDATARVDRVIAITWSMAWPGSKPGPASATAAASRTPTSSPR